MFDFKKPYKIKKRGLLWPYYDITYDDLVLFKGFTYKDAQFMCGALNGAYNEGRLSTRCDPVDFSSLLTPT